MQFGKSDGLVVDLSRSVHQPLLLEPGEAGRDAFGIEVQALGEITAGAPGMLGEEAEDARIGVA